MSRLVIVSNRIAPVGESRQQPGGLVVGILEAFRAHGGLWLGWSGKLTPSPEQAPRLRRFDKITVAELDLSPAEHDAYYLGFANGTLWPALHYRLDLMRFSRRELEGYCAVNWRFAEALVPLLQPDDVIWVHDYHLIPLAAELRARGVVNKIGFFLHVPFPARAVLTGIPYHSGLMEWLCAFDLIGLQSELDVACFIEYLHGEQLGRVENGRGEAFGRRFRVASFPISVDTENIARQAGTMDDGAQVRRLKLSLQGRRLMVGVDRLDYSKGLPQRFQAVGRLFEVHPSFRSAVSYLQIAPPTRAELTEYQAIKATLEQTTGRVNGAYAEYDWVPIRYVNKAYSRRTLIGLYRASAVGLVTPLRDGMNLVAKEYVAAQDPENPGVLVLSQFAGAAAELDGALIVNPYDIDGMTDAIATALKLPLDERVARYRRIMSRLLTWDVGAWREAFEKALISSGANPVSGALPLPKKRVSNL